MPSQGPIRQAQIAINHAIRKHILPSAKTLGCIDCGRCASEWHHRDHCNHYAVIPVCRSCHRKRDYLANIVPHISKEGPRMKHGEFHSRQHKYRGTYRRTR